MIKLGNVVYRNIQEQVAKNTDDIAKLWRRPVFQIVVVEELPEEGVEGTLYLVPSEDPEQENIYEEYLWVDNISWELIGTTAVDISNMCTTDTDQTITGVKTIANTASPSSPKIQFQNQYATLGIFANGYQLQTNSPLYVDGNLHAGNVFPFANGTKDIGSSTMKWKDIYLNGELKVGEYGSKVKEDNGALFLQGSSGVIKADNTLRPTSNNSKDLGETNYRWKNLYMSGDLNIGSAGKIWYNGSLFVNDDLSPSTSSVSLGKASYPWNNLYLSGNLTDGTNSVSVADLAALITYAKAQGWIS